MITGVSVTVLRPVNSQPDRFGNVNSVEYGEERVDSVLVAPGSTEDMEAARPEGVIINYTLHFPKSYTKPLDGCMVRLPQPWMGLYRVVGMPGPYDNANTPGKWHMPVEVEACNG